MLDEYGKERNVGKGFFQTHLLSLISPLDFRKGVTRVTSMWAGSTAGTATGISEVSKKTALRAHPRGSAGL